MENRKCLKCQSENLADAAYCRYCHEKFDQARTFVERREKSRKRFRNKFLIAGGLVTAAAGYIFRKRSADQKKNRASC